METSGQLHASATLPLRSESLEPTLQNGENWTLSFPCQELSPSPLLRLACTTVAIPAKEQHNSMELSLSREDATCEATLELHGIL
jgi:hypothetical protein